MSQQDIVESVGKPKAEVSKFLSMRDYVQPEVKKMAVENAGEKADLTGRHLYNLSKLKPAEQKPLAERIWRDKLTAMETERIVRERLRGEHSMGKANRGLGARRRRFQTAHADVVMTFRKAKPSDDDVRSVLKELRRQLGE